MSALLPVLSLALAACTPDPKPSALVAPQYTRPLVDHHQHLFSPAIAALLRSEGREFTAITAEDLVAALDAAGIRRAMVLSVAYMYGSLARTIPDEAAQVRAENDWTAAQVMQHPDRLVGFCAVNPLKAYAVEEVARCATTPGVRDGLKLHLANSDVQLDDPVHLERMQRVFRAANERHMAILVHLRANISNRRPYGAAQARIFLEQLLPLAPDVPVVVAHLAGTGPGYDDPPADSAVAVLAAAVARADARTGRLWFDVSGIATAAMPPAQAAHLVARIREIGPARILYGSDAAVPSNSPQEAWRHFTALPLTRAELAHIAANVGPVLGAGTGVSGAGPRARRGSTPPIAR